MLERSWAARSLVFLIALLGGNLPNDPEGGALTDDILVPLQFVLLLATAVGLALSFRWMAIAAGTVAFAGTGIAIISALQYESPTPILVSVAFLVPALMMWLDWQCRETLGKIVVLAVTTAILFAATWFGSMPSTTTTSARPTPSRTRSSCPTRSCSGSGPALSTPTASP